MLRSKSFSSQGNFGTLGTSTSWNSPFPPLGSTKSVYELAGFEVFKPLEEPRNSVNRSSNPKARSLSCTTHRRPPKSINSKRYKSTASFSFCLESEDTVINSSTSGSSRSSSMASSTTLANNQRTSASTTAFSKKPRQNVSNNERPTSVASSIYNSDSEYLFDKSPVLDRYHKSLLPYQLEQIQLQQQQKDPHNQHHPHSQRVLFHENKQTPPNASRLSNQRSSVLHKHQDSISRTNFSYPKQISTKSPDEPLSPTSRQISEAHSSSTSPSSTSTSSRTYYHTAPTPTTPEPSNSPTLATFPKPINVNTNSGAKASSNDTLQASKPMKLISPTRKSCRFCGLVIRGKSFSAADSNLLHGHFHRSCFRCAKCHTKEFQGNNNQEFYILLDRPLCHMCYHSAMDSVCTGCGKGIEGMCVEESGKWHVECYKAQYGLEQGNQNSNNTKGFDIQTMI